VSPTAKSLILDLLSTVRSGAMPVRALVAAGQLFDVAGNSIRVELARLLARGLIERNERGQYRLARAAEAVQSRVAAWRRVEEQMIEWRGAWIGAQTASWSRSLRTAVRRRRRAFELLGFRELEPALWVRPDNLRGGVVEIRHQLQRLGLEESVPVFLLSQLDDATEARARGLWDVKALLAGYREICSSLAASERAVLQAPEEEAMVETFLVGGRAIRQLAYDPLLPEPLVPAEQRKRVVQAMKRYDDVGRQRWSPFMRSHGAPTRTSPADMRLGQTRPDLEGPGPGEKWDFAPRSRRSQPTMNARGHSIRQ
jgi:phenylacetic acid degradation operon negative regulatory protein